MRAQAERCAVPSQSDHWGGWPDSAAGVGKWWDILSIPRVSSKFADSPLFLTMNAASCATWKIRSSVGGQLMSLPINDIHHRLATKRDGGIQGFSLRWTESHLPAAIQWTDVNATGDPTSDTSTTMVDPADKRPFLSSSTLGSNQTEWMF